MGLLNFVVKLLLPVHILKVSNYVLLDRKPLWFSLKSQNFCSLKLIISYPLYGVLCQGLANGNMHSSYAVKKETTFYCFAS